MKNKLSVLHLLLLFFLFSCKEESQNRGCDIIIEPSPEILESWNFPEGSWWLYRLQDSSPEVYDTVRITSVDKGIAAAECGTERRSKSKEKKSCGMEYSVYLRHSNKLYFPNRQESYRNEGNVISWYHADATVPYPILTYPFELKQPTAGTAAIVDSNDVTVPCGTFNRILHVAYYGDPNKNYIRHYYTSRDIGPVMIHYHQKGIWELVDYDVTP